MKILVVCLGNICRIPLAEGVLRHKFNEAGLEVELDSAGTSDYHIGERPDKRAMANMVKNGLDISMLRARQFTVSDFDEFDHIYVMDQSNYINVVALPRNDAEKEKVDLFMNLGHPGENIDVPDPYFGGEDGFQNVYEMLSQSADVLISKLNGR